MKPTTISTTRPERTWQAWALAAAELFAAYQAFNGGIGLMTNTWQMPVDRLVRTPFPSWAGPGWLLICLIGVPHVLAAVPAVLLPARPRLGILADYLAGGSLLVWIAMQLACFRCTSSCSRSSP